MVPTVRNAMIMYVFPGILKKWFRGKQNGLVHFFLIPQYIVPLCSICKAYKLALDHKLIVVLSYHVFMSETSQLG